jgi:hypothetical protein
MMGATKDATGTYAAGLSLLAITFVAGTFVLLELGTRWSVQWQPGVVKQSHIFCYRGLVRGLFGEEAA